VLPISDFVRRRRVPYVNWALIVANFAVFIYTLSLDTTLNQNLGPFRTSQAELFYYDWGGLPACIAESLGIDSGAPSRAIVAVCNSGDRSLLQGVTGMFLHVGLLHLAGNMLFLWIFGDNVEDRLGHIPYLFFYLLAGIAAMAVQTAFSLDSLTPTVGASGAIAGVMGAYLILHPGALIQVVVLPLFFIPFFVPASLLILFWFLMQVLGGLAELGQTTGSSIAWWAHIGGFAAGIVLIFFAGGREQPQQSRPGYYPP
jgi:membrane associated rhomboid family serine protease